MIFLEMIQARIALAVRRAVWGGVGAFMILIGLGFLGAAGFIALAAATDALTAALIIGGGFFGIGLLILGIASLRRHRIPARGTTKAAATAAPPGSMSSAMLPAAVQAFIVGLSAGIASGRGRRR
ncbi:hypothetical protein [Histidinibacterium aquaticum]|uniref:Phage holin family protein n=1 Tax=Histidinibacterium aquaticum TaxID=2613962 RepID=A0A5J5GIT7_9RHOB|nr:hypothetical protein [Histidinibacterium aquaticum]KAA9007950.1 hypothetical protein F3S47_10560 [Histidinibacterium aquaticum]